MLCNMYKMSIVNDIPSPIPGSQPTNEWFMFNVHVLITCERLIHSNTYSTNLENRGNYVICLQWFTISFPFYEFNLALSISTFKSMC